MSLDLTTPVAVTLAAVAGGLLAGLAVRRLGRGLVAAAVGATDAMARRLGYGELPAMTRRLFGAAFVVVPVVVGFGAVRFFSSWLAMPVAWAFTVAILANLVAMTVNANRRAFERALPGAIDLLVSFLRSGRSIKQACGEVAERCSGQARTVFSEAQAELELSVPPARVFDRISDGLISANGRMVFAALSVFYEKGGDVTDPLDAMAATFRELNKLAERIQVASQEARSTFWLVNLAGVAMVVTILLSQPQILEVYRTTTVGGIVLVVALTLWALGFTIMGRMIRGIRL